MYEIRRDFRVITSITSVPTPAAGAAAVTLDPANTAAGVTLSGGNLILTWTSANGASRSTTSHSTGKYYFEVTFGASMNAGFSEVGICNASASMSGGQLGSQANAASCGFGDSLIYRNGSGIGVSGTVIAAGNVVRIAVDVGAKLMWFAVNSGGWSGSGGAGTGDPATATGGGDISGVVGDLYVAVRVETNSNSVLTCNFGATAYSFTPPTGFGNW